MERVIGGSETVAGLESSPTLGWQSLCMPIPQDFQLNTFLQKLASEITDEDLQNLKSLLHGDGGLQKRTLSGITSAVDFFTVLKEKMYLNRENLIFVQACLWNVGRRDLHRKCVEFAKSSEKILHFYCPKDTPENGYQFIKFHVAGGLDTFRRPQLEHVQRTVAQLMGCQPEYVIVAGIEPSNSIVVTLMVLEAYIELLPCADKYELGLLKAVDVDKIITNKGIEIDVPCYGGYHASEIRNILKRQRDLEAQVDKAQRSLLEMEKERRKSFQGSLTKMAPKAASGELGLDFTSLVSTPVKSLRVPNPQVVFSVLELSGNSGEQFPEQTDLELTYRSQKSVDKGSDFEQEAYTHSIVVSNLPRDVQEEELREYFERRREHGGGPVKDMRLNTQRGEAIVNFTDYRAVGRLLQSKPLLFKTHYINVEPYHPNDDSLLTLSGLAEPEQGPLVTLEVSGFKPETREETLEDYFENEKSGGKADSISLPIRMEPDKSVAYVEFKDKEVAESVLHKEGHMLDGVKLRVQEHVQRRNVSQPKFYKNKVFVTGIDPKTTQDGLENYLQNRANVRVSNICRDASKAVVTFASDIDVQKLQDLCENKTLDDRHLTVEKVKVTHSVLVRNVLDTTTEDCLGMHFQYRVNGGKIHKIQKQGEDSFIVWFIDPAVTGDVCSQYHNVDGQELEVCLYYECLGVTRSSKLQLTFTPPSKLTYDPKETEKLMFLEKSSKAQDVLKSKLDPLYALAEIQSEGGIKKISVSCFLEYDVPDCRQRAKKWEKKVRKELDQFFNCIFVESVRPLKEIWEEVEGKKEEFESEAEGCLVIVPKKELLEVKVIGWKDDVSIAMGKLTDFIKKANEKLEKIKNEITEVLQLQKQMSLRILKFTKFCEKCEEYFPRCRIDIDEKNLRINFHGFPTDVYKAKCALLELLHRRSRVPVGSFTQEKLNFLESPKIQSHLVKKLKENNLKGFYEIKHDRCIEVNAETDEQAVKMAQFIKNFIIETPRKVSKFDKLLLSSPEFEKEMKKIEKDHDHLIKVVADKEKLVVKTLMVSELEKRVLELIDNFFQTNVMVGEAIELPPAMLRYLSDFCSEELENIATQGQNKASAEVYCSQTAVCVTAVESALSEIKGKVVALIQKIEKRMETLKLPSVVKYLLGDHARTKAEDVEHEFQCVITADKESFHGTPIQKQQSREKDMYQLASCDLNFGGKIVVVKQDLTELDVDVIVNAADAKLKLEGGLALVIGQKGGDEMYQGCQKFIRDQGPLSPGDVFCCPASGQLKCRAVVHSVGPVWQGGEYQEAELLREAIYSCLMECDQPNNQFKSIAIPAISTGVFNYPREMATRVIVETIKEYFLANPDSVIREVYLCDIKTLVVEAFTAALKEKFLNVVEGEGHDQAWKRLKTPHEKAPKEIEYSLGDSLRSENILETSIELTLYGHNQDQLRSAMEKFREMASEDYKRKDFTDSSLKTLNDKQKSKLQNKARELGVEIDLSKLQRIGRIKLHGLTQDVFEMENVIQKLLRKHNMQQQTEKELSHYQTVVQWRRVFNDQEEVECSPELNMSLEKYYQQQEKRIRFQIGQEEFIVDFTKMTLHDPYNTTEVSKLQRHSKLKEPSKTILPDHWSPMSADDNLITIPLNRTKQEYTEIVSKLKGELAGHLTVSSFEVERVQNRTLFEQYSAMKEFIETQSQGSSVPLERQLWHTVDIEDISEVNSSGFNRNKCSRKSMSLGNGVYFDTSLIHSLQETKLQTTGRQRAVYLCRVLTGSFTEGSPSLSVPPENKSSKSGHRRYDSVVDKMNAPQTFAVFQDSQAYPEYLIKFSIQ